MEREDKLMKFIKTTVLFGSFLLLLSLSSAANKSHLLSINPNINNEELSSELETLIKDFDKERQRIQNYYMKEIEKLKKERHLKVKTIKKEFGEKRAALLIKYDKDRKLMHSKSDRSNITDKKPIQKQK
tara:strand:+ start:261 stop:647 length:387 start_codon:yes stop_codon:yes gene_type:complete